MKPILFATNYSHAAENAGDYAAQLAQQLGTRLILLHTWTIPAMPAESVLVTPDPEELRSGERHRAEQSADLLHAKWNVLVNAIERNGFAPEEIIDITRSNNISLVVMGSHEHSLFSRVAGNTITSILHRAGVPLLLVPDYVVYKTPQTILLASDNEHIPGSQAISSLRTMIHQLGAWLEVVNVQKPEHIWNIRSTPEAVRLEHSLRFCDHSWRFELNSDVPEGIKHAAREVHADWIAIAPRHFTWFQSLFKHSTTEQIAFSSDKPVLILPSISN